MIAINGYYDGKNIIPLANAVIEKNQKVIITVLDEKIERADDIQTKLKLVDELAGMLNDLDEEAMERFDRTVANRMNISRELDFNE